MPVDETEITLHEAATALGVHYMTAYRYVRLGLLPAQKAGGGWRVQKRAVEMFRRGSDPTGPVTGRQRAPWAERFEARLVAGDGRGAWGVVEAAMAAGSGLDDLYIDVVAPAMRSIGQRWAAGELDVAVEHQATAIAARIVGRLGLRFARRGRTRGTVVLGSPAGERHALPISLVADLARAAGFEVVELGCDVPPEAFAMACERAGRLRAIGISVTVGGARGEDKARRLIHVLRATLETPVPIILGGGGIVDARHARRLGADRHAADGRELVELLDRIEKGECEDELW
jgi:excisionase family DNA binding protein